MVEFLRREPRLEIVILDNASTYPPLLDWYRDCPVEVVRLDHNGGNRSPWDCKLTVTRKHDQPYIVTDPDLDLSGIPADWLAVLEKGLAYPEITKCGFSLALADLPKPSLQYDWVMNMQQGCWNDYAPDPAYCLAGIDTTFALYRTEAWRRPRTNNLRVKPPYVARHLPWYIQPAGMTEEYRYYLDRARADHGNSTMTRDMAAKLKGAP